MSDCSVIIPAYNRRATLVRAVASALAQTNPPHEVIVVDDASSDGTPALVAEINDRRVKLVRHESNLGAAAARNTGASVARARWLAFLDGDDEWLPEKLALQLARLAEASPAIRASVTGYVIEDARTGRRNAFSPPRDIGFDALALGCPYSPGSTLVVAAETFRTVGDFDAELKRLEDWEWLMRYARNYILAGVAQPLAIIHKLGNPSADAVASAIARLREKHHGTFRRRSWIVAQKFDSTLLVEAAAGAYYNGDKRRSIALAVRALVAYPLRGASFVTMLVARALQRRRRL